VVVRAEGMSGRAVDRQTFVPIDVSGKASSCTYRVGKALGNRQILRGALVPNGSGCAFLKEQGAVLVGIDSLNIDDTSNGTRSVHTNLLGAGIPIVEHLCNLHQLPVARFTFTAAPVKVKGMGTFPVRAFARLGAE